MTLGSLTGWETAIVLAHAASTWFMVGLIWMVQRVTYPGFSFAAGDGTEAHRHHTSGIGPIVGPPMGIEAATAVLLVVPGVEGVSTILAIVSLAVPGVVQASTAFLQVPSHGRLSTGYDSDEIAHIVRTNWIRTVGWTVRGGLALVIVLQAV